MLKLKTIILLIIYFNLISYAKTPERLLNLQTSISLGLQNNQELLILNEQISYAKQRVNEAQGYIYPRIDFSLNASQYEGDIPTVLYSNFDSLYLPQGSGNYFVTRISLWQYLYAGGRYKTNIKLAEINLSKSKSKRDSVKNKVIRDIKINFYSLLYIKEKILIYERILKDLQLTKQKDNIIKEFEARINQELDKLNYDKSNANLKLVASLGLELNTDIDIEGDIYDFVDPEYELNKCLAWALQYRPELRQTQFQETIDTLQLNLSLTERYPTITMGANFEYIGNQIPLDKKDWNATLNVSVPLFDGWASWSRIKQKKYQIREGKIRRSSIEDQIQLEVRESFLEYNYWKKQLSFIQNISETKDLEKRTDLLLKKLEIFYKLHTCKAQLDWATGKSLNSE